MRFVQLIFSPTGGVKRAAGLLSAPMAEQPDIIDLSLPLNGTPRFSPEDVCLIAVPCFGGDGCEYRFKLRPGLGCPTGHDRRPIESPFLAAGDAGTDKEDAFLP